MARSREGSSGLSCHLIRNDLVALHEAASATGGWDGKQTRTFINVCEYALALDGIAYAYLDTGRTMPPDMFETFEKLAIMMDLAEDPEFEGVARLRAGAGRPPG